MSKFFHDLVIALLGRPDGTKIGRAIRAFLLATLAALLLGLVDVTRQWFVIFSTGVGQIDWHTVQVIILDAIVPLFLVWVVSLARYFQNEASQIYTPSPEDAAPYIAPRNLPDEKR